MSRESNETDGEGRKMDRHERGMSTSVRRGLADVKLAARVVDDLARVAVALYDLTQKPDCPDWVRGAGRELCRDYHVNLADAFREEVR